MRRMLFPSLVVVLLFVAYAGQQLAAGAPSAPRASAQTAFPVARIANEAKALKHIAVAVDRLLENRAPADPKKRRLATAIVRKEALVAQKADKIIADAHKAQTAQVVQEQELEAEALDLSATGPTQTQQAEEEFQRLHKEYQDVYGAVHDLLLAEEDMFTTMSLSLD